jgi:glycosyltransferase involved in cell wall biosynthesis
MGQARKGFASLVEALHKLPRYLDSARLRDQPVLLMTAGGGDFASKLDLPFPHHHLGLLGDDRSLALAYSAADLYVSPSTEDAGPMVVNESLACGTPVVAYEIGTAADEVEQGINGWLARPGDSDALAHGLARILDSNEREQLRARSREVAAASYSPANVARRYLDLYAELISEGPR